ncbi:MAG: hypothetical protein JOZ01_01410, partial [Candidatus Eremiobacteraeota bacterium]|nr:hypothetical protein [Candidatus Eremiobacteraeota bacterium]
VALDGFYAPASARDRVGVGDDASPLARAAAAAVIEALAGGNLQAFASGSDPDGADCARKPYAAYVYVTSSAFTLVEGTDVDIGVRLEDCGGWIVGEWHDHATVAHAPVAADARELAFQGIARMRDWARSDATRSASLFQRGAAIAPGDRPTYFYAMFKTVDGNMRAYVRGGGPAYAAGLRSGDVIDKIDGTFWWEYGTYQAQQRAYDGKPHTFELERNGKTLVVRLGEPFTQGPS